MSKRYNQAIPFGWYAIEYSDQLAAGDVKPLRYFGRDLVLYRTESGEAALLDAYCPHLGAHLGHGGCVKGESISCPFHAWEFNSDGFCTSIPYARRLPPRADGKQVIRSYPVVEKNLMIWAWYHPQAAEPSFEVAEVAEFYSEDWTDIDTYQWTINSIIQETGENAVDLAHFITVHSNAAMPEGQVIIEGHMRTTLMDSEMEAMDEEGNIDRSGATTDRGRLESYNYGPGQTYQRFSRMFDMVMMGTITPIDDQNIHMRFIFSLPRTQTDEHTMYANGLRDEVVHQVGQDIPIWENKTYLDSPILCDGDGPIAKYRKWFQQFYAAEEVNVT